MSIPYNGISQPSFTDSNSNSHLLDDQDRIQLEKTILNVTGKVTSNTIHPIQIRRSVAIRVKEPMYSEKTKSNKSV